MHIGKHYKLIEFLRWTRKEVTLFAIQAIIPTFLYQYLGWKWLALPWTPVAIVGTAAAFLLAFRNNSTYDRVWEARIIWGSIVNLSRTWGIQVRDLIIAKDSDIKEFKRALIYRHFAWVTALRFQLRQKRKWEDMDTPNNREYLAFYKVPEWESNLDQEIKSHLDDASWARIKRTRNPAAQIVALQSKDLNVAFEQGWIDSIRFSQLMNTLGQIYDEQGKCERIKDFPYPRQFATINRVFIKVFILLIPLGLLQEFSKSSASVTWLTVPVSMILAWIFHSIEKIGAHSENPFQGGPDDVPISSISRNIEIDLREMFQEQNVPAQIQPKNSILM
jgi:putative membrane protein